MANDNDLFAPPSEDELYAAPSESELIPTEDNMQDILGLQEEQEPYSGVGQEEVISPEETGKLSAFAQHAAPSVTLGLSDVIAGGAGAAGQAYGELEAGRGLPSKEELLKTYYEAKGETAKRREKAFKDQPGSSIAGMVAGGFATPIPGAALAKGGKLAQSVSKALPSVEGFKKAEKLNKLAKLMKSRGKLGSYTKLKKAQLAELGKVSAIEGGKAGAILGASQGEAKLLEGELAQTAKETVVGTAIGAGAGALFSTGMKASGDFIADFPVIKEIGAAFKRGIHGKGLGDEEVTQEIVEAANKFNNQFSAKLKKHGSAIGEAKKIADDLGMTINTKKDLDYLSGVVDEIDSPTKRKQIKRALAEIYDYIDDGAEQLKLQDKIEKQILKKRLDGQGIGETARLKQQNKAFKQAIEKGEVSYGSETGQVGVDDILGESGPGVMAVRKDEIMKKGKMATRLSAEDATPFIPSATSTGIDPSTGRQYAAYKDVGTGKVSSVVGDSIKKIDTKEMTIKEADRLKNLLQDFSSLRTEGPETLTQEVKQAVTKASQTIDGLIKDATSKASPDVKFDNLKYSKLKSAMKELKMVLPKGTKMSMENRQRDLQDKLHKFIVSPDSTMELKKLSNVIDDLSNVDQKMALEFSDEVKKLRDVYQSQQRISQDLNSTQIQSIAGSVMSLVNRASNALGRATSAPFRAVKSGAEASKTALAKQTQQIVEASPQQMQDIIGKISTGGNKSYKSYIAPLERALKAKPRQKQAIMFGLMQQPVFRDMVSSMSEEEPEIKE